MASGHRDTILARRDVLRLGLLGGLAAPLLPRLALAANRPDLMPHVAEVVARWVGPGKFPGLVASLGRKGTETRFIARGTEGFADPDPVTPDSLFRIYSMTKPVTGMAAMMLVDDGKLGLDQPLADILPKFARMQVQDSYDGSLTAVHPARAPITIRNLITHTSGLGYSIIQQGPIRKAMIEHGVVAGVISRMKFPALERGTPVEGLETFADRLAELPLVYDPGTRWSYSLGLDLMGRVIEVVSGKPFDVFLKERLFDPLGMTSTFFQVPASEAHRLTTNHAAFRGALLPIDPGPTSIFLDKPGYPFGGSGLVSSPRDYDRFLAMIGNYGSFGGKRVMSERAVRMGTSNLLPPGVAGPAMMTAPSGFGAGGRVGLGAERGVYGWAGAAGTLAQVNLRTGIRSQFYAQFMPPTGLPVLAEYATALDADIAALLRKAA